MDMNDDDVENMPKSRFSSSSSDDIDEYLRNQDSQINNVISQQDEDILAAYTCINLDADSSTWGGSVTGHAVVDRNREIFNRILKADYFASNPTYGADYFRRRFRMSRNLFLRLRRELKNHSQFWKTKINASHKRGFSSYQKICASIQMLAYGCPADQLDQYFRMGESTVLLYMKEMCKQIVQIFGPRYLRAPNQEDVNRLLEVAEARGFPGMLGSLDCMHWGWKNCPTGWSGAFRGRKGNCTIILEAVASYDLWFWHANFGLPGTNNNINVLNASNLFHNLFMGRSPPANYSIMGRDYTTGYYLADGIYPKWSTLVRTIAVPKDNKQRLFAKMQESYRKDVERAFGVLQARWAIIKQPARLWNKDDLDDIITACIILHNMIVEEERSNYANQYVYINGEPNLNCDYDSWQAAEIDVQRNKNNPSYQEYISRHNSINNREEHKELKERLTEHLWIWNGQNQI